MEQKDKKRFVLLMSKLKVTFPNSLTAQEEAIRAQVYWEEFQRTKIEDFESAVNDAIKCSNFFPKPAELHQIISEEANERYRQTNPKPIETRIEWAEPTEEGRQIARECLDFVLNTIEERETQEKKERNRRFEQRRAELKKQAPLITKENPSP